MPASMEEFQKDLKDPKIKKEVQEKFKKDSDRMKKEEREAKFKKGLKGLVESDIGKSKNTFIGDMMGEEERIANQRAALERMRRNAGLYQEGGSVGNYDEGGILSRIIKGVRDGYQALKNIKFDEETESLGKYDPFTGMSRQERLRIGLAMMGQMPELGQGPLSAAAAGASTVLGDIKTEQLAEDTLAAEIAEAGLPDKATASAFNTIRNGVKEHLNYQLDPKTGTYKFPGLITQDMKQEESELTSRAFDKLEETGSIAAAQKVIKDYVPKYHKIRQPSVVGGSGVNVPPRPGTGGGMGGALSQYLKGLNPFGRTTP